MGPAAPGERKKQLREKYGLAGGQFSPAVSLKLVRITITIFQKKCPEALESGIPIAMYLLKTTSLEPGGAPL